ncbi:hypothetical protein ABT040_29915 [Streptomyces sp. NPDC002688]|uniref:hypothetical protein n=1 Tax=Streptomyces sp. NPDC002688 TaxID=3154423 RepID=UPI00331B502F
MTDSYKDTMVQRHADEYAARHDGRHPYTDCWPWASAAVAWPTRNAERLEPAQCVLE